MDAKTTFEGQRKAAIFLLSLADDVVAEVFRHMEEDEIRALSAEMAKIKIIPKKTMHDVLEDFRTAAGGGGDIVHVNSTAVFESLRRLFGADKARVLLEQVQTDGASAGRALRAMPADKLAELLVQEHPQTVALVLAQLGGKLAADTLALLPEELQSSIVLRIAHLDAVSPEVVREVMEILEEEAKSLGTFEGKQLGGIKATAEMMNILDRSVEEAIMGKISELDSATAEEIQQSMFVFEDILNVDDRAIRTLLRHVSNDQLALALKAASEALKGKLLGNISERAAEIIREDMEAMGPVKRSAAEKAQQEIVRTARKLEQEDQLDLGTGGEEVVS